MDHVLGVAWAGAYCFLFSFLVSRALDNFTPKLDKSQPKWRVFSEVTIQFALIGIVIYGARILVKKITPRLGEIGELRSLPLLVFIFMFFQTRTQEKMRWLARMD
jgi:hypothetical protein